MRKVRVIERGWRSLWFRLRGRDWVDDWLEFRATYAVIWTRNVRALVTPQIGIVLGSGQAVRIGKYRWGRAPGGRWHRCRVD